MSDFTRLENVLVKLRQREMAPGQARTLRGDGGDGLLAALVTEVDETILPRRLIITTDAKVEIHLAAANRRLQALLSPVPAEPGAKELADVALKDGQDPKLEVLGELLRSVLDHAGSVTISARRLPAGSFDPDIGAPSSGLSSAWGVQIVEVRAKEPTEILDEFLNQITEDDAEAWLRIEGENVTDQAGSAERLAELGEQAAVFLDSYFSKFDRLFDGTGPTATVIAPEAPGQTAALFVEIGGLSAFVATKSERAAALATNWQTYVAE